MCDRVGIISAGYLRTVGSKNELKRKYGKGYSLMVSVDERGRQRLEDAEMVDDYHYHQHNATDALFNMPASTDRQQLLLENY